MQKIKQFFTHIIQSGKGKDILLVIIIILVALGSFELGRLSKADSSSGIKIEYTDQAANAVSVVSTSSTIPVKAKTSPKAAETFFASKRGHKYYPAGCSAGKSIKQENRVYFATREEAQASGYELSSSCR